MQDATKPPQPTTGVFVYSIPGAVSFSIWFYVTNICMVLSILTTVILYVFASHLELEVTEW